MTPSPGVLYVVATPIGNLEDLTFRALRILKDVDLIAAEDTRRTAKLLAHYDIRKSVVSLREHNEARETPRLIAKLAAGSRIALVSDAGTPAIADPGARLVRAARERALPVVPIPGPSAVTAALSVSGLSSPEFVFMGFPPASGSRRRAWFNRAAAESRALVFFEAPHRVQRTLSELESILVNRPIYVHREISKLNEISVIKPNTDQSWLVPKGEFTIVVESGAPSTPVRGVTVTDLIGRLANTEQFTRDELIAIVSAVEAMTPAQAKKAIKKHLFSVK